MKVCNTKTCKSTQYVHFKNVATNEYFCYDCCLKIRNYPTQEHTELFPDFDENYKEMIEGKLND